MSDNADWVKADNDHLYRMEQERTKQVRAKAETRKKIAGYVAVVVGTLGILAVLVAAIWTGVQRSNETRVEQIADCTQSGGTMFNIKGSGAVCLHLREGVPQ